MKVKGDVTCEMGMEAYTKIEHCPKCRNQVLVATTPRKATVDLDMKGIYKPKPGRALFTLFYEVNPLSGKLVDGVQYCQPFDPSNGDKTGWRVHQCPPERTASPEELADHHQRWVKATTPKGSSTNARRR